MTVQKLERVMWRIRTKYPDQAAITNQQLRRIIMKECGTDPRTYKSNRKALIALGWLKARNAQYVRLTGADMTGDDV